MFDGMSFDDINKLHSAEHKNISMPYEQYFGEMALTDEQIERRIETARSFEDAFIFIASLMFYMVQMNAMNYDTVYEDAVAQYRNVLSEKNIENTDYFSEYHVPAAISEIIDTTVQNPERTFNYSYDRVMLIAENEANAVWNDAEFQEAIDSGKTNKRWLSIIDKRTRDSHRYLDGKTKPIMEPFEVGEYLMMFPKDESFGAGMEEIANCRCSLEYYGIKGQAQFETLNENNNELVIDYIHKSVGANYKNYDILDPTTGEYVHLVPESRLTQPKDHIIAGKGRNRQIDIIDLLVAKYPEIDPYEWTKEKGFGYVYDEYGEERKVELHWYQAPGVGRVEMKIKPLPGGEIYLD